MPDMENKVTITANLCWPFLVNENPWSEKQQVDVCNLSKEDAKKLTKLGINVRQENKEEPPYDRGLFVTCYSKFPFTGKFKWPNKQDVPEDVLAKVGNGTKVRVQIAPYPWNYGKKTGVSPSLVAAVILDLVEYEGSGVDDELFEGLESDEVNDLFEDEDPEVA